MIAALIVAVAIVVLGLLIEHGLAHLANAVTSLPRVVVRSAPASSRNCPRCGVSNPFDGVGVDGRVRCSHCGEVWVHS